MPLNGQNIPSLIGVSVLALLVLGFFVLLIVWLRHKKYGKVKSVQAEIIDKSKHEFVTKYAGKQSRCSIVFLVKGKKEMSFYVSELSYDGYRVGEKGILRYNGERIIDFY